MEGGTKTIPNTGLCTSCLGPNGCQDLLSVDPTTEDGYEFCSMQRGKCACDGEILMGRWNTIGMKLDRKEPDDGKYHAPGKGAEQVECNPDPIGTWRACVRGRAGKRVGGCWVGGTSVV